ncbi:MAG: hypothetical protein K6T94_16525 [Paenibacillus sp.]|nr:hypothetical protein [Paenibacillus sp.]
MKRVALKWMVGIWVVGLLTVGITLPGEWASAATTYTYKDEVTKFTFKGGLVNISGSHVVWRSYGTNGAGQIYYGNTSTGKTFAVTKHGKFTDSPAVGINGSGEPIVVWADKRDYSTGETNFNWDIYTYNVKKQTETKLNVTVGQHITPLIEGNYVVWHTNPNYEMHLYDMTTGTQKDLGLGRNPVIGNGRIVYNGGRDGDLYEYVISSGSSRKILDLPDTSYVERFVFNGKQALWKERNLDLIGKNVYLNLDAVNPQPTDLTLPVKRGKSEYRHMSISKRYAVWLETSGDKIMLMGVDLELGNAFNLGAIKVAQFVGFNGEKLALVIDNKLVYRNIVRSN